MRFPRLRPRFMADGLRELARRRPAEAEEYLDAHQDEWEALAGGNPQNAADILEAIDELGAAELLADLGTEEAAEVLDEMRPEPAADVLEEMDAGDAAALIEEMDTDQAADLLAAVEDDVRAAIIHALGDEATGEVLALLAYPPDTAGGLMTTDVAALPVGLTAGEAIEALRRLHDELGSNLSYVYVIDDSGVLLGVVSFRDLVFSRPGTGLDEVMVQTPVRVTTGADREVVSELIQRYHLLALPVTDARDVLIGMVRFDEAIEAVQAEATEDITQMVGAGREETVFTPVSLSIRRRLPWIVFNLFIGLLIALVIGPFRKVIEEITVLAALMPMVALLGGNSGAQSLAVVIRAMAVGELPPGRAGRAIRREVAVGAVNAVIMSLLAGLAGAIVTNSAQVGVVIGIAVAVNLVVAGLAGASIPVALRRLGQDPALASNIFLTMVTDLVGFGGFLATATILL